MEQAVELTVQSARKRDAGRGIARLASSTCRALGVLSGETILLDGPRQTVTKVWPGGDQGVVRMDAETRQNAGVNIGDQIRIRPIDVTDARSVRIELPTVPDSDGIASALKHELQDRPVQANEAVYLERLGARVTIAGTTPSGMVRITDETTVSLTAEDGDDSTDWASSEGTPDQSTEGRAEPATTPSTSDRITYEDIGGLDDELEQIREMIELPLSDPALFRQLGVDPPKGVLLYGPPGTGKTLIAKAVANEVNAHFETISGPEIVSKYKGDTEERLRETFETAARQAPTIVFIDEIDSIAGSRDDEADMENRVVTQLLTLLDGIGSQEEVVVIGATNRVDTLDPALRRGGRFDREIEIGVPDESGRREILDVHTRGMPLAADVDLDQFATRTHGFVGADVRTLVTEAAMIALRRYRNTDSEELTVVRSDLEAAMAAVEPSAMREYVVETPTTTFDDVGGLEDAKATLREAVEWPLTYHALFETTQTEPPSGVLLYGPPGTGKTLLARALAGESDVNFIHVAGPELVDKYVGESEKALRELFERARQTAPTIVFFDEIDALAGRREESHEVTERVVSQLLTELDGMTDNPNLMVLAATNRREALDPALLRPGRLESHVEIPLPDEPARRAIFEVHSDGKPYADGVDLDALAATTDGWSGAELEALIRQASMLAIREFASDLGPDAATERAEEITITAEHFEAAREQVRAEA
ncbi:AAA family ATPase [Halocatena pleomorpha]|uniref:AAA family ATPase n=1 Tax=Halocatena pleomorpha TaxID=1785090 RepID=A0A3P3RK12_9EURY|nr:AAA family ATPase [Halocatena pleomorpha]RRJ33674.1 AAA family ATPase [Halocatena pleomorpha]